MSQPLAEFTNKALITVAVVAGFLLAAAFVYFAIDVVLLFFGAVLLAIFLRGLADLLSKYLKISEGFAVLLVSLLLAGVIVGGVAMLAPSVGEQVRHLREEVPRSLEKVRNFASQYSFGRTIIAQIPTQTYLAERIRDLDVSSLLTRVGGYFSSTVGAVGNFFVMVLLAIYLASEPRLYADGFTRLFPVSSRPRVRHVLGDIGTTLSWWLIGKTASMFFIGLLTWIGLSILGVPLALTLGLIAGLLSFIPNFGPIISAIPAILLAFIESPISAVYVLILFVVVQLIESNLVTPYIERQTVELPPALTVFAQLALSVLIGGVGLILATPIVAFVVVLVKKAYIEDVLGDRDDSAPADVSPESPETTETEPASESGDDA